MYFRATRVVLLILGLLLVSYLGAGGAFLELWINKEFGSRSYDILIILSLAFALNIVSMIVWLLAEAFHAPGLNALSSTIWTLVAIPAMIAAAAVWQSDGVAVGRLAGVLATIPLIFYIEKRFLGDIKWRFWSSILVRLLPAIGSGILLEKALLMFGGVSWPTLILAGIIGSSAYCAIVLLFGILNREEISALIERLPFRRSSTA